MTFWLAALGAGGMIALILVVTLLRGRAGAAPAAAYDLQVYREQLQEVERDLARGVITEDEASRIRTEVSRRVLEADRKLKAQESAGRAPQGASIVAGVLALTVLTAGAFALYSRIGAPGYPDLPMAKRIAAADALRENRPSQARAEDEAPPLPGLSEPDPEHVELVEKLRSAVAERPNDVRGQVLLARNEAALGNFNAAYTAQQRAIELKDGGATAEDYATLADMMVLAAGGYVSPEAEAVLMQALGRDQSNGTALYYWGLMRLQTDRPDLAFRTWRGLLQQSAPGDPWYRPIREQIENLAQMAGVRYTLPPEPDAAPPLRGPSAEDVEAAQEMTPEQQQEMIRGMVARLSDRLASQGGRPQEWAQLLNALGVLGDTDQAGAIWAEAQQVFAGQPEALETVRQAAVRAGVAE
ncbi:cytochrome c-type biogenesis protein CcmH [Rhodovulum iodosum]|uniref:Cytochrome c-type biogenesis protein CcmH n=1 Tax=Rhodovulum iodosum TaxID=68291 RepID=A0ABV3XN83_9RHOB|nr:c-type cytochrome biogenesis protein CcmI [Rhodovulum robiginosum]RSK35914.1 c-type cytochrome biogenesis protein CcmI [Rhodovulum robiginosum]